jgi:hypothetical protein
LTNHRGEDSIPSAVAGLLMMRIRLTAAESACTSTYTGETVLLQVAQQD